MPDVSLAALPWLAGLGDIMSTVAARAEEGERGSVGGSGCSCACTCLRAVADCWNLNSMCSFT